MLESTMLESTMLESTMLEAIMITITPPMLFRFYKYPLIYIDRCECPNLNNWHDIVYI